MVSVWELDVPFFTKCKYALQRAKKGYCDYDLYDLCYYYSFVMSASLKEFECYSNVKPKELSNFTWRLQIENTANDFRDIFAPDYNEILEDCNDDVYHDYVLNNIQQKREDCKNRAFDWVKDNFNNLYIE